MNLHMDSQLQKFLWLRFTLGLKDSGLTVREYDILYNIIYELTLLHRRIIGQEMPGDWKGNGVTNFHLQWEDKDGDRLPIENRQDFMIANQEMIRTVLTPTIFVILSSLSGKY